MSDSWSNASKIAREVELNEAMRDPRKREAIEGRSGEDYEVDDAPEPARAPEGARLVVVEHFSLSMIDFDGYASATIHVRQISKLEASKIVFEHKAEVANTLPERSMQLLEQQLQMPPIARVRLVPNVTFLTVEPVRWNDVRFYLVRLIADADGVIE